MSDGNLKTIERIYEAAGRRDREILTTLFDNATEIVQPASLPWGGTHRGLLSIFQSFIQMNYQIYHELTIEEIFEDGDRVVMVGLAEGAVKKNNRDFSVRVIHIWTFENGKARRMEELMNTAPLLELLNS